MTRILDGKALAAPLLARLTASTAQRTSTPLCTVVQVGHDPASDRYVAVKRKTAARVGIGLAYYDLPTTISQGLFWELIERHSATGPMIVQRPLPPKLAMLALPLAPRADVDAFDARAPYTTPLGRAIGHLLMEALSPGDYTRPLQTVLDGKRIALVGHGATGGRPIADYLRRYEAVLTIITIDTPAPMEQTRTADIVISAVGTPGLITEHWLRPEAVLIDAGTTLVTPPAGKAVLVGDCTPAAYAHVAVAAQVPGGVGPLTVAYLLDNIHTAQGWFV